MAAPRDGAAQRRRSLPARLASLRPSDVVTIARALGWMAVARVLIKALGFPRAAKKLGLGAHEADEREARTPDLPAETRRAVRTALVVLRPRSLRVSCLPRSIALERVLRARGVAADIVLGWKNVTTFEAHAWVEVERTPIGWGEVGSSEWSPVARFRARSVARADGAEGAEAPEVRF